MLLLEAPGSWRHTVDTVFARLQLITVLCFVPLRSGRVNVAGKPCDELAPGTLRSIETQSGVHLR